MIFNTFSYFLLFLVPGAVGFRILPAPLRPWWIAAIGALFFVYFSVTELAGWIGATCLLLFLWESFLSRLYSPGSRWCLTGVAVALVSLGLFKYWNFVVGLVASIDKNHPLHWAGQFLPLGISFFTFEFIHYAVDRWKGRAERGTVGEYLAFILFFPTMVAGPIKRFQDFLPNLRSPSADWALDWRVGTTRILSGLAKKFAIADLLTAFTDHLNAADIATADRWVLPIWLLAYGMKIYADFSAYSDIAIGSARLFGLKVPENFDWPYLQTSISGFWRHWHISLGKWLTDYVFIPLGGSRNGLAATCGTLMVTMLVSGVWHGAGLNFVVWGAWHGGLLVLQRCWSQWFPGESGPVGRALGWVATFTAVNLGWAFFCMDLPTATLFLRRLFLG